MSHPAQFPDTWWTQLAIATMHGDQAARDALENLCQRYRGPVLALFRAKSPSYEDAEDLTQRLLAQLTLSQVWKRADREKGRFRDFLRHIALNAFRNYLRYLNTGVRGSGRVPVSLDLLGENGVTLPADDSHDCDCRAFDREWAQAVIHAALQCLENDSGWARYFPYAKKLLPGSHRIPSNTEAAAALKVNDVSFAKLKQRLLRDFAHYIRCEVRKTLRPEDDLKHEMDYLRDILEVEESPENSPSIQNF